MLDAAHGESIGPIAIVQRVHVTRIEVQIASVDIACSIRRRRPVEAVRADVRQGSRRCGAVALENVGTNGYAWSSSSYAAGNVNAGMLNFNSGNVNPLNNGNRGHARAVRCVQHLQELSFIRKHRTLQPKRLQGAAIKRFIRQEFAVEARLPFSKG